MPLTVGEQQAVRDIKRAAREFQDSVDRLVRLESMKAANLEASKKGQDLPYTEQDFLKLLDI